MKTKLPYRWILALLPALLPACSSEEAPEVPAQKITEGGLNFYVADYKAHWSEPTGSRSLIALGDAYQKQIHNLMYLFYDAEGYIEKIYYQEFENTTSVAVSFDDFKDKDGNPGVIPQGHLYVVGNTSNMNVTTTNNGKPILVSDIGYEYFQDLAQWKQTVSTVTRFKQHSNYPIFPGVEGVQGGDWSIGRPDRLLMFGFYDGDLADMPGATFQIPMGRLAARVRIALDGPGLGAQALIKIENVPIQTVIFPEVNGVTMNKDNTGDNASQFWSTYTELIDNGSSEDNTTTGGVVNLGKDGKYGGITGAAGNRTATLIYYMAENNQQYMTARTKLTIQVWDAFNANRKLDNNHNLTSPDAPNRVYEIELGHDGPDLGANRDYSIYMNTSYTFNLTLQTSRASRAEMYDKNKYYLYPTNE